MINYGIMNMKVDKKKKKKIILYRKGSRLWINFFTKINI